MDYMKQIMITFCSLALLAQIESAFAQEVPEVQEEEPPVVYSAGAGWTSKYISEGRDNLTDEGMFIAEGAVEFYGFTAGAWYGIADTVAYDELKLCLEYCLDLGPVELCAGYTRLEFFKDGESDNELMVGAELTCIPYLIPAIEYVYSTEAGGSFVELAIGAPIKCTKCGLVLIPYVLEGFDFGFASDDYNGFNNFQVGIIADYPIMKHLCLVGSVNHSWANQDVRKDGGGDESWLSLGLKASF